MSEVQRLIKRYEFLDNVSKIYGFNEEIKRFIIPRIEILKNINEKEEEFNILVFGDCNSGKGTFINQIIGEEVLPHLVGINNFVPIKVKIGKNNKTIFRVMKDNNTQKAQSKNLGDIISQDYNSQLDIQKGIDHYLVQKDSSVLNIDRKKNVNLIALNTTGDFNNTKEIEYVSKANKVIFIIDASKLNLARIDGLLSFAKVLRPELFNEATIIVNKIDIAQRVEIDEIIAYISKNFEVRKDNLLEMSLNTKVADSLKEELQALIDNSTEVSQKQIVDIGKRLDLELEIKVNEYIDNTNIELKNLQLPITKEIEKYTICSEQIEALDEFKLKEKALKAIILNYVKKDYKYEVEEFKTNVKYDTEWHSYDEEVANENETIPGQYKEALENEVQGIYKNFLTKINLSKDAYIDWFINYVNEKSDEYLSGINNQIEQYYLEYNIIPDEKIVRNVVNTDVCHVDLELDSTFEISAEIKSKEELETEGIRTKNTKMAKLYKLSNMSNFNMQTRDEFLDVLYDLADRIYDVVYPTYAAKLEQSLKLQKEEKVAKVNNIVEIKKASIKTIAGVPQLVERKHRLESIMNGEFENINLDNEAHKFKTVEPLNHMNLKQTNVNMKQESQMKQEEVRSQNVSEKTAININRHSEPKQETRKSVVQEPIEEKVKTSKQAKPKKKRGCGCLFIIVIILICFGVGGFYFGMKGNDSDNNSQNTNSNQNNKQTEESSNATTNNDNSQATTGNDSTTNSENVSTNNEANTTNNANDEANNTADEQDQTYQSNFLSLAQYKTATGVIDGNTNVNLTIGSSNPAVGVIHATEVYPTYPNQIYNVDLYENTNGTFTGDETYHGKKTGKYELTLVGSYMNGTFTNLSTGKVYQVILRLVK